MRKICARNVWMSPRECCLKRSHQPADALKWSEETCLFRAEACKGQSQLVESVWSSQIACAGEDVTRRDAFYAEKPESSSKALNACGLYSWLAPSVRE